MPDYSETYRYDRADQLVEVVRTGVGANRWHYNYDPAGNRTTEQIGNAPVQASFDNMNRLLSTGAGGTLAFKGSLDEPATVTIDGQPAEVAGTDAFQGTVESTSGTNTVVVEATDPSSNTRTNTYEVEVSGTGTTYDYDENGNLIEKDDGTDVWTYEWNAKNQLIAVVENETAEATFKYDPLGRRVEKVAGETTTTYTYDGEDVLREIVGATTVHYVHGTGVDEPLTKEIGGTLTYFHADGLGSVLKMTNNAGSMTHEYRYGPYGRIEAGATVSGYAFTGREWDPETGLHYYRARYYDPEVGRFISEDQIGFAAGPNFYAYVSGNPVGRVDPFGLADGDFLDQMNPFNLQGSLAQSGMSIADSLAGMATGDWASVAAAGATNPLGQTEKGPGWAYWGTRASLACAAAAAATALGLMGLEAVGVSEIGSANMGWKGGEITFTRPGAPTPDWRVNPFGGEGWPPHYHRRPGIGKHRPWEGGW
jgi:RHS repeat-associated protein